MEIGLTTFILVALGVLYLGYTIGIIHGAVVAAKEVKKKDETVHLYQTMIAEMTTMMNAFMEKKNEDQGAK